jgi:hypothetical protein
MIRHEPDRIHKRLKKVIEVKTKRYLWTPADAISFVPRLSRLILGDGRALFHFTTLNNRPAFWVIRGDCAWDSDGGSSLGDFADDILTDLEEEFGNARCGYSGADLYLPKKERDCDCEECSDKMRATWPMVDGQGGCSWSRTDWPKEFRVAQVDHYPFRNVLAAA